MLLANPLNESSLAFPALECVHIAGFICGVGTAALVNFRLLGIGLTEASASKLWSDTTPWTLGGLTVAVFSGLLLFSIDPEKYYVSDVFRLKLAALVVAIAFYYTLVRAAARGGRGSVRACISLALWALVPLGGVLIGFKS